MRIVYALLGKIHIYVDKASEKDRGSPKAAMRMILCLYFRYKEFLSG